MLKSTKWSCIFCVSLYVVTVLSFALLVSFNQTILICLSSDQVATEKRRRPNIQRSARPSYMPWLLQASQSA